MSRGKEELVYSNKSGKWIPKDSKNPADLHIEQFTLGQGIFPYNFDRRYEACESFNIFKGKQQIVNPVEFPGSKYLRYTMGFEFETSAGLIPEDLVFRDGLIPLRDGSISGLEYSSVVLTPDNDGLSLLKQQLETLRKYTSFNKECALHIHFGKFPMKEKPIYNLYLMCYYLQGNSLRQLVPPYTFDTPKYKKHRDKNYCGFIPKYGSFKEMFYDLTNMEFNGSYTDPHPADPDRHHKWNINKRYYWINFMNLLCYNVNKTVEFRFLRPTYNLEKIMVWVYIFNAMMQYAEKADKIEPNITFFDILRDIYPEDFFSNLWQKGIVNLITLTDNQVRSDDLCGAMVEEERRLFDENAVM